MDALDIGRPSQLTSGRLGLASGGVETGMAIMDAERWWLVAGRRKSRFAGSLDIFRWDVERLTSRLLFVALSCWGVGVCVMSNLYVEGVGL